MKLYPHNELSIITETGLKINKRVITLLQYIDESGSINTAVKKLEISYSHGWNILNKLNCKLDSPVVITKRGGNGGGVSTVTDTGKELINAYGHMEDRINSFLQSEAIDINTKTDKNSAQT